MNRQHDAPTDGEADLVKLDKDHPGFRDRAYRERRNAIAQQALSWKYGQPIPDIDYSQDEHGVWRIALQNLKPLHDRYAPAAFKRCWPLLGFGSDQVPSFSSVNQRVAARTGFQLAPVAGLVTPRVFMEELGRNIFLATQYMRHHSAPLYTPEPDVIHELVGHAALLADEKFAAVNRLFGEVAKDVSDQHVEALIRVYWYALEFGVAKGAGGLEVVGAGLLSSFGELGRFETHAKLLPFDIKTIAATPFDPTEYQGTLFVAKSADAMLEELTRWLSSLRGGRLSS